MLIAMKRFDKRRRSHDALVSALLAAILVLAGCSKASPTPSTSGTPVRASGVSLRAGADSVVPPNGPNCTPRFVSAPDLVALHTQHPATTHAPGTLGLDNPALLHVLTDWPDPRSFVAQATPKELAAYGFAGEPAYSTAPGGVTGPSSPNDPVDIVVFHGDWSADQVNLHGVGHGAHVRWVFVDARSGAPFGGGYADCTAE
jgi:hypothetical protein